MSSSSWATRTFGFEVLDRGDTGPVSVTDLVLPGLRRNPRRAHLLVSTVLGKHIAASPAAVIDAGHALGDCVRAVIGGDLDVLGMAETATSLGHCVADRLDAAVYIHTTRRPPSREPVYAGFQEGHSHATDHTLQPAAGLLAHTRPLVIVDDEISTGTTALAAIRALHRLVPRPRYVVASLVDVREPRHEHAVARASEELGVGIDHVCLAAGRVTLPDSMIDEVNALPAPTLNTAVRARAGAARRVEVFWPATVPDGGRHGFTRADRAALDGAVDGVVDQLGLDVDRPVLVVGHEEFMYLPLRVADQLARAGYAVRYQSSTRSPAYVHDVPDYPLRRGYRFTACEDGDDAPRFLYNGWQDADPRLVLMVDAVADTTRLSEPGGVVDVLTTVGYDVLVAAVHAL